MLADKKILIVSASIGSGHDQAAKAVASQLNSDFPQATVHIVDFMSGEDSYVTAMIKETYLRMLAISPNAYQALYRWTQAGRGAAIQNLLALMMYKRMEKILEEHRPDIVIATHPFPCGAVGYLKEKKRTNVVLAAVITDFAVHRMWMNRQVDLYFTAGAEMGFDLLRMGIPSRDIYATGIPISALFNAVPGPSSIKEELGLDGRKPTILIMGGGLGLGGFNEVLAELNSMREAIQIIVVTGRNTGLQEQLASIGGALRHPLRILGFTERIPELMASATLLVTKPGALTISEALAVELPMIFYEALPGQEKDNAVYISRKGAAIYLRSRAELQKTVENLLTKPQLRQHMKNNASKLRQPMAAAKIVNVLENYLGAAYNVSGW